MPCVHLCKKHKPVECLSFVLREKEMMSKFRYIFAIIGLTWIDEKYTLENQLTKAISMCRQSV